MTPAPLAGADPRRFGLMARALSTAIDAEAGDLAAVQAIEARGRPGGRSCGLEWAADQRTLNLALLGELRDLIAALEPREADVRALATAAGRSSGLE